MRDGTGNELISLENSSGNTTLKEANIFGSERIGALKPQSELAGTYTLANRTYDLKDHLGNIRATVTDERTKLSNGTYEHPCLILAMLNLYRKTLSEPVDLQSQNHYLPNAFALKGWLVLPYGLKLLT